MIFSFYLVGLPFLFNGVNFKCGEKPKITSNNSTTNETVLDYIDENSYHSIVYTFGLVCDKKIFIGYG